MPKADPILIPIVVESYEMTGRHTYLPMSITIGCLLVLLLCLVALYKELAPRVIRSEVKEASNAVSQDMYISGNAQYMYIIIISESQYSLCRDDTYVHNIMTSNTFKNPANIQTLYPKSIPVSLYYIDPSELCMKSLVLSSSFSSSLELDW